MREYKLKDRTGQIYGRLKAIRPNGFYQMKNSRVSLWLCECQCENKTLVTVRSDYLQSGHTKSCGCLKVDIGRKMKHKPTKFDMTHPDYGIGYATNTNAKFLFDKSDYDLIKDLSWHEMANGYIYAGKPRFVFLHRLIMQPKDKNVIDHINHDIKDNRRCNLRECFQGQNRYNSRINSNNTSGYKGVWYDKSRNKWAAEIHCNNKKKMLGRFDSKQEAVEAYTAKAKELFGEYYCER